MCYKLIQLSSLLYLQDIWDECSHLMGICSILHYSDNGRDGVSNHQPYNCLLNRCSGANQRKHQSSASLAFVWGIQLCMVNSLHKWPVTRKRGSIWWRHHDFSGYLLVCENNLWAEIRINKARCLYCFHVNHPKVFCCHGQLHGSFMSMSIISRWNIHDISWRHGNEGGEWREGWDQIIITKYCIYCHIMQNIMRCTSGRVFRGRNRGNESIHFRLSFVWLFVTQKSIFYFQILHRVTHRTLVTPVQLSQNVLRQLQITGCADSATVLDRVAKTARENQIVRAKDDNRLLLSKTVQRQVWDIERKRALYIILKVVLLVQLAAWIHYILTCRVLLLLI